jgi:hypothetical protein
MTLALLHTGLPPSRQALVDLVYKIERAKKQLQTLGESRRRLADQLELVPRPCRLGRCVAQR